MAELELKDLLADEEGLKKVLEAAGALLGQPRRAAAGTPAADPPESGAASPADNLPALPASPDAEKPDLGALLGSLLGSKAGRKTARTAAPPPSGGNGGQSPLSSILPQLLQTFSGKTNYIDENRLNLVKAIKPYLAENKVGNIDRAIKMANMAKVARNALGLLGR